LAAGFGIVLIGFALILESIRWLPDAIGTQKWVSASGFGAIVNNRAIVGNHSETWIS
jgi:uncharacterized membrane protein YcjF (UPF0283 family)